MRSSWTGKYTVALVSPTGGAYTLKVTSPDADESDKKATRAEKIKRLKQELKELEAEEAKETPRRKKEK